MRRRNARVKRAPNCVTEKHWQWQPLATCFATRAFGLMNASLCAVAEPQCVHRLRPPLRVCHTVRQSRSRIEVSLGERAGPGGLAERAHIQYIMLCIVSCWGDKVTWRTMWNISQDCWICFMYATRSESSYNFNHCHWLSLFKGPVCNVYSRCRQNSLHNLVSRKSSDRTGLDGWIYNTELIKLREKHILLCTELVANWHLE